MRPFIIPAIMFSILVLFLSCDKDEGPDAFFINEIKFKKVQFMDLSKKGNGNIVRWEWNFGDGTTSTEEHPLHTYSEKDTYAVSLAVTDENNLSDAITKEIVKTDYDGDIKLERTTYEKDESTEGNTTFKIEIPLKSLQR